VVHAVWLPGSGVVCLLRAGKNKNTLILSSDAIS